MSEFDQILDAPEDMSVPTEYGGFLLRFVAYIIDAIVMAIPIMAWGYATMGQSLMAADPMMAEEPPLAGMGLYMAGAIIIPWLYYAFMESGKNQATLGKMALSLKVVDVNGGPISFLKATGRHFGKIVSGLTLLIGYIMAAFTEKKQALHDMMAGCLVVKK